MKRVYLAGCYSADNVLDVLKNIGRGEYYAGQLFMAGYAPFCPWHDASYAMDLLGELDKSLFYKASIAWLEVSDGVYVLQIGRI